MRTEQISIRVDTATKAAAEEVFQQLGLSPTDAVRMFYRQVAMQQGLPFHPKIPNATTIAAMKDGEEGKNLQAFERLDDLFASWKPKKKKK